MRRPRKIKLLNPSSAGAYCTYLQSWQNTQSHVLGGNQQSWLMEQPLSSRLVDQCSWRRRKNKKQRAGSGCTHSSFAAGAAG